MAQIKESRFRVRNVHQEDIDLIDLATNEGVIVECEHEYYKEDFEEQVQSLEEGDIIDAQIQSEDILQPNSIWRFLEFEQTTMSSRPFSNRT
jgi:hypothetical protein